MRINRAYGSNGRNWRSTPTGWQGNPGSWREGARGSDRQKLPTIWWDVGLMIFYALGILIAALGLILGVMGGYAIGWMAGSTFNLWNQRRYWKRTIVRRNETRARNLDRVEDWIIRTDLPESSPELQAREDELERLYADMMKAQGKRPDGTWLPDPESKRSAKRRARAERRAAAREREHMTKQAPPAIMSMNAMSESIKRKAAICNAGEIPATNCDCGVGEQHYAYWSDQP